MAIDLLFGQSYFLRFDPKLFAAMQPFPPLGTLYAAAAMREQGYSVALFDAMLADSEQEWQQALTRHQPRVAVLYEDNFNYLSKMCLLRMREAATTMIAMAKAHGCPVVVAGADASDHPEHYLIAGADLVIVGEGEATLAEVCAVLLRSAPHAWPAIAGLAYRDSAGEVQRTPRRPLLKDLHQLPPPARDLVDIARYESLWRARHGEFALNMVTTRGCPFHCNWCAKPIWGQRYTVHPPEQVVAELKQIRAAYRPDRIWFADDIMGLRPGWWQRFADLVEAEGVRTPFKCLSRADLLLREGEVAALARAGAEIVWIGAESGSQRILDAMEKGTTVAQIRAAAALLHQHGVKVGFFLQFGYPSETREEIEATLQMVRECQPDDLGMSVSYPLPGTTFYERVRDQLGQQQNWHDSQDLAMLYAGPFSTAFYRHLHTVLHREFRAQRAIHGLRTWFARPRLPQPRALWRGARAFAGLLRLPAERRHLDALAIPQASLQLHGARSHSAAATPSPQED